MRLLGQKNQFNITFLKIYLDFHTDFGYISTSRGRGEIGKLFALKMRRESLRVRVPPPPPFLRPYSLTVERLSYTQFSDGLSRDAGSNPARATSLKRKV